MKPGNYPRVDLKAALRLVISSHQAVKAGIATHAERERVRRGEAAKQHKANAAVKVPGSRVGHEG